MRTRRRSFFAAGLMLAVIAGASSPAAAGSSCTYNSGTHTLTYFLSPATEANDAIVFVRSPIDDAIEVYFGLDKGQRVGCLGSPTVYNTDEIVVSTFDDDPSAVYRVVIDLSGGDFAPGKTDEAGSSDEIEFVLHQPVTNFSNLFRIIGGTDSDRITFGANGINLNADEADGVDADVDIGQPSSYFIHEVFGGMGADVVSIAGGAGTGAAGSPSNFTFGMGEGRDTFVHDGAAGRSSLGGAGVDTVKFGTSPSGVDVDLRDPDFQAQGFFTDIENLVGSPQPDVLKGNGRDNRILGGNGSDIIYGRAGDDLIDGQAGAHDDCTGGTGQDQVLNCEQSG